MTTQNHQEVYWHGPVPSTDDFGNVIAYDFVDGRTAQGPWAMMSLASHREHGVGLGLGKGQRYTRRDGRWIKVEG